MDRAEILDALGALASILNGRGLTGEMYVVPGAAIALAYDERRATRDIDAVFEPKSAIYEAAREVAELKGLPPGWLNDAVKGFLAGPDPHAAMVAHRIGEDEDDVLLLARELGLATAAEVLAAAGGGVRRPARACRAVLRRGAVPALIRS